MPIEIYMPANINDWNIQYLIMELAISRLAWMINTIKLLFIAREII